MTKTASAVRSPGQCALYRRLRGRTAPTVNMLVVHLEYWMYPGDFLFLVSRMATLDLHTYILLRSGSVSFLRIAAYHDALLLHFCTNYFHDYMYIAVMTVAISANMTNPVTRTHKDPWCLLHLLSLLPLPLVGVTQLMAVVLQGRVPWGLLLPAFAPNQRFQLPQEIID